MILILVYWRDDCDTNLLIYLKSTMQTSKCSLFEINNSKFRFGFFCDIFCSGIINCNVGDLLAHYETSCTPPLTCCWLPKVYIWGFSLPAMSLAGLHLRGRFAPLSQTLAPLNFSKSVNKGLRYTIAPLSLSETPISPPL